MADKKSDYFSHSNSYLKMNDNESVTLNPTHNKSEQRLFETNKKYIQKKERPDMRRIYLIRSKVVSYAMLVILLIGFFAGVIYYEINFFRDSIFYEHYKMGFTIHLLMLIQVTSCICLILAPFRRYYAFTYKQFVRTEGNFFLFSYEFKMMLFEMLLISFQPMFFLEGYQW